MTRIWMPQAVACLMLAWAINPENPYGYYILLRWVCCGVLAYLAVRAYRHGLEGWTWMLAVTAGVYNPILRVHLTRDLWTVINLLTIGLLLGSTAVLRQETKPPS